MPNPIDIHSGADMPAANWAWSVAPIAITLSAIGTLFGLLMIGFRTRLKEKDALIALQKQELEESRAVMRDVRSSLSDIRGVAMQMGGSIQSALALTEPGGPIDPHTLQAVLRPAIAAGHESGIFSNVRLPREQKD